MRHAVLALAAVTALSGCITMPETGAAARTEFLATNALGIERANSAFVAWLDEQTELEEERADARAWDWVESVATTTATMKLFRDDYMRARSETRGEIRAWRATPLAILAEYQQAGINTRKAAALSAQELEVIRRANSIGGTR